MHSPHHRAAKAAPTRHLIGECPSRYYNVKTRCLRLPQNVSHASLCQTGFPLSLVPKILDVMGNETWIDMALWSKIPGVLREDYNCVGIKGLPGRAGVGVGHQPGGQPDPDLTILRDWIGDDVEVYEQWAT